MWASLRPVARRYAVHLGVDREKAHGRPVFRGHVGDRRPIHDRQGRRPRAVEFDKFSHHLGLAQQLREGQGQIRRGDALADRSGQVHPDHVGGQEVDRLPQHPRLGLDPADAPADDAQAVDHRGVGVGADQRVRIDGAVRPHQHPLGQEFQVHLVDDADPRRDDFEGVEGLHAPLQELVALVIAGELQLEIAPQGFRVAGEIDLHGMVHHQVDRHQRLDQLGILPELGHRRTHRRQIDQKRHPREILQHDPGDHEGDFLGPLGLGLPAREGLDRRLAHPLAVAVAQQRLEDDADRHRQPAHVEAGRRERGQRIERMGGAVRLEALQRAERIREAHASGG